MFNIFKSTKIVGKDIKINDINEFYYTYASSTYPPKYQRYLFYRKDSKYYFYHEKREGDVFPLTEEYITISNTIELDNEEWNNFFDYINNGKVIKRKENTDSGYSGPWLYLYWENDKGVIQEFSFETYNKLKEFENYCIKLKEMN